MKLKTGGLYRKDKQIYLCRESYDTGGILHEIDSENFINIWNELSKEYKYLGKAKDLLKKIIK